MITTRAPRITVSEPRGYTITSRRGEDIARAVSRWIGQPTGRELELIEALRRAVEQRQLYIAGCICDDLKLNFAYSYPGEQEP